MTGGVQTHEEEGAMEGSGCPPGGRTPEGGTCREDHSLHQPGSMGGIFGHTTSSQHYPQSNGKAENAVKTVKRLFGKCREASCSEYRALLDWYNTQTEGVGTNEAECFLGHHCYK